MSPACQPTLQILDSPNLHNHISQFLKINLLFNILLVPFLWRTLTNIVFHQHPRPRLHFLPYMVLTLRHFPSSMLLPAQMCPCPRQVLPSQYPHRLQHWVRLRNYTLCSCTWPAAHSWRKPNNSAHRCPACGLQPTLGSQCNIQILFLVSTILTSLCSQ